MTKLLTYSESKLNYLKIKQLISKIKFGSIFLALE